MSGDSGADDPARHAGGNGNAGAHGNAGGNGNGKGVGLGPE